MTASGSPWRLALVSTIGPASIRSTSSRISLAGTRRPIVPLGETTSRTRAGQLGGEAVAVLAVDDERHRPGPAAAGEPAGQRGHVGHEVDRFFGALDGDREGGVAVAVLEVPQPLDGFGVAGAGADAVDRFRGKRHQLPFGECLNRSMNDVSSIFGVSYIDDNWRHGQARSASPQ